jgi:predicted permease
MTMQWLRMLLRALFGRADLEAEMDREMRAHVEMEVEENVRRGMSPEDARRAAYVAFGGMDKAKESVRDERSTRRFDEVLNDLRFALRGMRRRPIFSATVILLLALGVGANTAIFSVIDQTILRPFPMPDGNRVVTMVVSAGNGQFEFDPPQPVIDLWKSRTRLVEQIVTFRWRSAVLGDTARGKRIELDGLLVQPGAMAFVSMRPALGRDVLPTDTLPGARPVVILSDKLWRTQFGGRPDIVGTALPLNVFSDVIGGTGTESPVVIGIAPKGFFMPFGGKPDFLVAYRHDPRSRGATVIGKLRKGSELKDAAREASSLSSLPIEVGMKLDPPMLKDGSTLVRPNVKRIALMLFGAVSLVLLIACANVANLLLARTWFRQREFAVRGAMGAGRGRIARQLFTENMLLALTGGLLGFVIAIALVKLIVIVQPDNVGFAERLDFRLFAWAVGASLVAGTLLAIAPALLIGDGRLNEMLKSSARSATSPAATRRLRSTLVVAEVALSVVLLVGAGLLIRTIVAMQRADVGLNPTGLASMTIRLSGRTWEENQTRRDQRTAIMNRVRQTPGIEAAAFAFVAPPDFGASLKGDIEIEGRVLTPGDSMGAVAFNVATSGIFSLAGLRFIEGRPYDDVADREVVVNERFARRFWPNGAIGARVRIDSVWMTVVGVVANVFVPGEKGLASGLQHYRPLTAAPPRFDLVVRSALPAGQLEAALKQAVREAAPPAMVQGFEMAADRFAKARAVHRFMLGLVGAFAGLALILAAIGLSAVIGYSVTQRMREIGIRIALGAQNSDVAALVMRQGVTLAIAGVVIGSIAGLAATRLMQSMLFGVSPGDPVTMVGVAALLIVVAILACAMPARRALMIDPAEMVRAE